jgi:hypothetical protein
MDSRSAGIAAGEEREEEGEEGGEGRRKTGRRADMWDASSCGSHVSKTTF